MASKYIKQTITVSNIDKYFGTNEHREYFIGNLAKRIVDEYGRILGARIRPPKPPSQKLSKTT